MSITGDEGGNLTRAYIVIRSWKHHSTDGILGVSLGAAFPLGQIRRELNLDLEAALIKIYSVTGGDTEQ